MMISKTTPFIGGTKVNNFVCTSSGRQAV